MEPLPIDALLPGIREALEKNNSALVLAEPGAGKTTRVPPALLNSPFLGDKEVWVLQPRRLAAKMAALRVAEEMGEPIGQRVGYHFRFENQTGPRTRLKFLTDGMLIPLSQGDPELRKVGAVVLDEFHERSLSLELGLAWLKRLQQGPRPDLRLLLMSATLDPGPLASYLGDCPVLKSTGRVFPVTLEYRPEPQQPDLSLKVKAAVKGLAAAGPGTTLVFLPGLFEIDRCRRALAPLAAEGLEVHSLYGDLSLEDQRRALEPSRGKKVILSTNLAETSLTVPGVTAVVDSGLTRQSRVSAWSGLSALVTVPASQASCLQRMGRAGRLQAGTCLRLFTQFDFEHRAAFDLPELLRTDLSKSFLDLLSLGITDLGSFPWLLKPPAAPFEAALELLRKLGALDGERGITAKGRRMARFPLPPRLSAFLLEIGDLSGDPSILREACRLAALVSGERAGSEDLLEELRRYQPGFESKRLAEQLIGWMGKTGGPPGGDPAAVLAKGLLAAFPDRVARVRREDSSQTRNRSGRTRELLLSGGGMVLAQDSALTREHEYFVVVEAQETEKTDAAKARSLCPIEMDWLLDLFPDSLLEERTCQWNAKAGRVEGFQRLKYGQLVLDEKNLASQDLGKEGAEILFKQALNAGPQAYCDPEELEALRNRSNFAAERTGDLEPLTDEAVEGTLRELCGGRRSLSELRDAGLVQALRARWSPQAQNLLERLAPSHTLLAGGRRVEIHYERGKPPWVQSRLQDFFGMSRGPALAGGEVPLVLHLLSPGKKPVQITSDLGGFWKNHYPQVRRELMRRYPRHAWPEDPLGSGAR